jgi:hypothetical protein
VGAAARIVGSFASSFLAILYMGAPKPFDADAMLRLTKLIAGRLAMHATRLDFLEAAKAADRPEELHDAPPCHSP